MLKVLPLPEGGGTLLYSLRASELHCKAVQDSRRLLRHQLEVQQFLLEGGAEDADPDPVA